MSDIGADERPLILHVIHRFAMGGMENGIVNLLNRIPEARFRHAIACIEDYSDFRLRLRRRDVEMFALNRSRVGVWRLRRDVYRLCRRLRPAVVHTRNLSGLDALLPARLAGVAQCVHGEHGWDVGNLQGDNRRLALLRRAHRPLVDRYVTVSKDLQNYLIARVGVAPARITQIYNGVDTDRFSPRKGKPPRILPEDFVTPGRLVIGTVGRIEAVKNHSTLVRAFANLVQARSDIAPRLRLAIVGAGPLLNDLRTLVKTLGVEPLVWLPGARDDVPDVLRAFDVFVLPSLAEGVSNTILEAMASGLPILAGAVGGNVEIVEDGRFGRLFAPQEPNSLMHLMSTYADDDSLREQHAREARHVAVARFDLVMMVDRYQDVYETMCQSYRECAA